MSLFFVMTNMKSASGTPAGFTLDLPHTEVSDVCDALSEGEFLCGSKITYVDGGRGGKLITGREPFGIHPDQVATVALPKFRFWEPERSHAQGGQSPLSEPRAA